MAVFALDKNQSLCCDSEKPKAIQNMQLWEDKTHGNMYTHIMYNQTIENLRRRKGTGTTVDLPHPYLSAEDNG